ncbi:transglycosylase SLT domain-containing protein [Rhizobiaceae bacterium n13]|uniref:Transglycosylase SLT domain-containing protein n=1 Tax=Ferirhizobium litorale TaxID=2927786 RepID=A0AAE3U2K1_9HYPH|nr:transglycosylase SLT domain-containing protein [Fererhizobium litorale]MDI7860941.1 transglycosylase SLT domain-containing protein [Fererhizobium litorale]MDI7921089.1 transglycosylase SLT domain-containing protein [Fererhizobium litorale]
MRGVLVVVLLLLAGCGTVPSQTRNACAVFEQRDGIFNNWRKAAESTEREYGVPVPILMATIYAESGYQPYARPPRTKLLGFIPWKRPSSAYGYAQALDGTWERYKDETGRWTARRSDFSDAVQFIGWYHRKSHEVNGIPLNDPYRLYLAYHSGHAGYAKGSWRTNGDATKGAKRAAGMATIYSRQLNGGC